VYTFVRGDNAAVLVIAALATLVFAPGPSVHGTQCDRCELTGNARSLAARQFAQADADDEGEIPEAQVDKYIAVYAAMQRNHSLTVEQAAARQGFTMSAFRQLENRIQRNPSVHDRVLRALRAAAKASAPGTQPTPKPK
jgi:hypothetical protein